MSTLGRRLLKIAYPESFPKFQPIARFHDRSVNHDSNQLTTTEVAHALRPFYFKVHPDKFWLYPVAREANESSLQFLNQHLEQLVKSEASPSKRRIKFYVRKASKRDSESIDDENFTQVQISLSPEEDINQTVQKILVKFDLSDDYLKKIGKTAKLRKKSSSNQFKAYKGSMDAFWMRDIFEKAERSSRVFAEEVDGMNQKKQDDTLIKWLELNIVSSRSKDDATKPVRDEIRKLNDELVDLLGINKIVWDSNWSVSHFRACLESLKTLAQHRIDDMQVLRTRTLVFGLKSGISVEGNIILSTEEVRQNWIKQIKVAEGLRPLIEEIPRAEECLSQSLNGVRVRHRKFMPSILIQEYMEQLLKLTKSVQNYRTKNPLPPSWNTGLENIELVVECDAGPLMLSPYGQFIAPASCPAAILIDYMTSNLNVARRRAVSYQMNKNVEQSFMDKVRVQLSLATIEKDDNVTPDLMIECMKRFLQHKDDLANHLVDSKVKISNYYAVQETGEICIPWNWNL
ncbi:T-cell activation inhibitor, mitochondrial [Halotydeus destructor]|nr:T-cell activation inhibitor, mitochondrial [Halotydeus destructor]